MKPRGILLVIVCLLFPCRGAADAATTTNPHGNLKLDCKVCHTEDSWRVTDHPQGFDHDATGFALTGLHKYAECRDCHRNTVFAFVGTQCLDCHDDFHKGRLGPSCEDCHTPAGWIDRGEMGRRHQETALPLTGAHARIDCESCHTGAARADYVGTPTDCFACHAEQYAATTDPPHAASGIGTDCRTCHGVFAATWGAGDFVHPQSFPLSGGHAGLDCAACHESGAGFTGVATDCASCHRDDYDATTDPDHAAAGFPLDCTLCHTINGWEGASIDHDQTAFPLTGMHVSVDCAACHATGYSGTPQNCDACHLDDYNGTVDPNHAAQQFPLDCAGCHETGGWTPAIFDHTQTTFPLTGAHVTTSCTECHSAGYAGTPTDCQACHLDDYNATTLPDHGSLGFPLECMDCHTTSVWNPSTFDHEAVFPINSGPHRDKWNSCADCHVVQGDITRFECIFCHEHNRTDTDKDHREVSQYVYDSNACYACHPRGRSD